MKKYIKAILFGCLLMAGGMVFGQSKEVMLVEEARGVVAQPGIWIYRESSEPEFTPYPKGHVASEKIGKVKWEVLDRLYKEGWRVASSESIGEGLLSYIFEREKL